MDMFEERTKIIKLNKYFFIQINHTSSSLKVNGGRDRIRTCDPLRVEQVL